MTDKTKFSRRVKHSGNPGKRDAKDKSVRRGCEVHGRQEGNVVKTTFRH